MLICLYLENQLQHQSLIRDHQRFTYTVNPNQNCRWNLDRRYQSVSW